MPTVRPVCSSSPHKTKTEKARHHRRENTFWMGVKKRRMKRPPAAILFLLAVTITLIPILHRPLHTTTLTTLTTLPKSLNTTITNPETSEPLPQCKFITPPSGLWSYNSRSFCVFPTVCITPSNLLLPNQPPQCAPTTASFRDYHDPTQCSQTLLSRVSCAYTQGMRSGKPSCDAPEILEGTDHRTQLSNVIVVPSYPFPANIYHFANIETSLLHHIRHHNPSKPVTILFRGGPNRNSWQASFHEIIMTAVKALNPWITYRYVAAKEQFCGSDVTLLGRRGHINVWPFPNTTEVKPNGLELPAESIFFRDLFYKALDIDYPLVDENEEVKMLPHPPLVLGYARRLGPGAVTGGNVHAIGTMRRFSDIDEEWFEAMLKEETREYGVELRVFTTSASDSLKDQVSNFASLGGVIGIHGANLVNSMFMPPLSMLIEVFPAEVTSLCYFAGGNAGLKYIRFESEDPATPEESGCTEGRCLILKRQRLVKIGRESERIRMRESVREGLGYLTDLRTRFPDGVPVVNDPVGGMYKVVE